MIIEAEIGQYILQTRNSKKFGRQFGDLNSLNSPYRYASACNILRCFFALKFVKISPSILKRQFLSSNAGTNLKVGETHPAQSIPLHVLVSTRTISRFDERLCDGQYSLVSFLFAVLLLTVPPVPSHL